MEQGSNQLIHIRDIDNDCVGSWCVVLLEVDEDDNICIRKNLSLKGLSVQRCKACLFGFVRKCLTYLIKSARAKFKKIKSARAKNSFVRFGTP